MSMINTVVAQTVVWFNADKTQESAAAKMAASLKDADAATITKAMLASANTVIGLPEYTGAVIRIGKLDRPQIEDAAGNRHPAHQKFGRMWTSIASKMEVPGSRESGAGPKKAEAKADAKKDTGDRLFAEGMKLLSWEDFRKLGERILAACDANDKA